MSEQGGPLKQPVQIRWECQQHSATLLFGSVCSVEMHLNVTGLGTIGAVFSEEILAVAVRLVEHKKHFVVLLWNIVLWGLPGCRGSPRSPTRCLAPHVPLMPTIRAFSLLLLCLASSEVSAL